MARYDSKADFKIHEFKTMGKSRDAEAMDLLKRMAHQVQPIMRRREWRVPLLSEFFPSNPNLLGLNIGGGGGRTREIRVRLRPARDPDSFLPYDHLLGTMLHELVHNVRSPHDSVFYKLLDELTSECEELMARGVGGTGVGFDAPSCGRLGSHGFLPQHNPPAGRLRDVALKAAEERAKRQRIMPSGPRRLGGAGTGPLYANPAAAAAAAAERRCQDNRWCPCERLAGAVDRALAEEVAEAAAAAAAGGGSRPPAPPQGATKQQQQQQGQERSQQTQRHQQQQQQPQPPSRQRVEEELVRRIEDGAIDLTADSDSESDSKQPREARGHGGLLPGPRGAQAAGGHGHGSGNASGSGAGEHGPVAGAAAVKRERPEGGPRMGRGDGDTGGSVVPLVRRGVGTSGGVLGRAAGPSGRAAAPDTSAALSSAQPPQPPDAAQPPRPALQVLQPRNPVAAAAAAAALARMQSARGPAAATAAPVPRSAPHPPPGPFARQGGSTGRVGPAGRTTDKVCGGTASGAAAPAAGVGGASGGVGGLVRGAGGDCKAVAVVQEVGRGGDSAHGGGLRLAGPPSSDGVIDLTDN